MATADVIIVGGGLHGCSAALHLAMRGLRPVVVEKDHAGRHASGANAGGVRQLLRHEAEIPLSARSMAIWANIRDLVQDDCGFESHGQVSVAETEADMDRARARVARLAELGFHHEEILDRDALREMLPAVAPHAVGGLTSRADGAAIPFRAVTAFRRRAQALGARFLEGVAVTGLAREGGAWTAQLSDGARLSGAVVLNCAGAWADRIAAMLGDHAPVEPMALMLMITQRMDPFIKPVAGALGRPLSFKQFQNGTVLIGGGLRGRVWRDENRTELDFALLARNARTAAEIFPVMRGAVIQRAWAGIEGRMPDDIPVIGRSAASPDAYHAFGFSAHGFQLGPGVGQTLAELIVDGETPMPLTPFRVERFHQAPPDA
jgi:sarcosine oxidase subunit beta